MLGSNQQLVKHDFGTISRRSLPTESPLPSAHGAPEKSACWAVETLRRRLFVIVFLCWST